MKKAVKVALIVLAVFVLFLIGLSIFVKSYLSSDRLKAILLPKAEVLTGRKVNLDKINVSLFKGIVAKGLSVKERDGQRDFLKAGEFILSYNLLPLLKKQLVITKIEIASLSISIKRNREGKYNFNDLTERRTREPQKPSPHEAQGLPLSIIADRLAIRNAHFTFVDEEKALPDVAVSLDAEFKGSIGKEGTPRLEFGHMILKEIKATLKDMEVKTSGRIDMDTKALRANLQTVIGKDSIDLDATVRDYLSVPDVIANLHARHLDLEKLMGLSSGKKPPEESSRKKEKKSGEGGANPAQKLKASGKITVDVATYQHYTIKDFHLNYQYVGGKMKLEPLGLQFSGGDTFAAEGSLDGNFQFKGEEASAIQKTLSGKAVAKLGKGVVKESQIFDAIVLLTGISDLKNPGFDQGLFNFDIKEEKINLDGFISSNLFKITPKGVMDFDKKLDIAAELKISPALTRGSGRGLAALKFIEDDQGWKTIPLKIRGTTDKPKVGLDEEALKRQLGPSLKKGLEKLLQGTTEESGKPSQKTKPGDVLKELFGK